MPSASDPPTFEELVAAVRDSLNESPDFSLGLTAVEWSRYFGKATTTMRRRVADFVDTGLWLEQRGRRLRSSGKPITVPVFRPKDEHEWTAYLEEARLKKVVVE